MTDTLSILAHHEAEIPSHIKGLIFDCDGTLIDTMPIHYRAWRATLDPLGIPFSEERFYAFAGAPTVRIIEILSREHNKGLDAAAVAHQKEEIYVAMLEQAEPICEVIAIARREKGRRKLAVASGGWKRVVMQSLEAIHCADLFEIVVGADDVARGKPNPDIFLEAARRMGLTPGECLVFEDAELGFQAAKAAGMALVDVRPWYLPRESGASKSQT